MMRDAAGQRLAWSCWRLLSQTLQQPLPPGQSLTRPAPSSCSSLALADTQKSTRPASAGCGCRRWCGCCWRRALRPTGQTTWRAAPFGRPARRATTGSSNCWWLGAAVSARDRWSLRGCAGRTGGPQHTSRRRKAIRRPYSCSCPYQPLSVLTPPWQAWLTLLSCTA
ncbi:hypothetical protein HaLaN_23952, partial [Haematococcus lacustris]